MLPETDAAPALSDDPVIATGTPLGPELLAGVAPDVAFAVWQVLRTLRLWTAQPEGQRDAMFDGGYMDAWERALLTGSLDPDVRFPLAVIVGELNARPAGEARLSWACVCVADWALGRGAVRAALAFAEAAALASPLQARYAWLAGRLLRTHGEGRTAERWLRRAYQLAVAQKDGETQARAMTALGNLWLQRGNFPAARSYHTRALRISRRWRVRETEGMALHDLFAISIHGSDRAEAERCARGALDAYRHTPRRIPTLAHDVAYWWMGQGYFSRALRVFEAVRPHISGADMELRIVSSMARAVGGLADRESYDAYLAEGRHLMASLRSEETLAASLLEFTYGAVALGDWPRAMQLLDEAESAARAHDEADVLTLADALRTAVERQSATGTHDLIGSRGGAGTSEQLAEDFVELLSGDVAYA